MSMNRTALRSKLREEIDRMKEFFEKHPILAGICAVLAVERVVDDVVSIVRTCKDISSRD